MAARMLIDATHPEETRVVVVKGTRLEEFDFETSTKKTLKGNIYLAKVTRVEPSLQAAFVEYGGNRHGFLAFSEIHPDYYQIPKADREALLAAQAAEEEAAEAEDDDAEDDDSPALEDIRDIEWPEASTEAGHDEAASETDHGAATEPVDPDATTTPAAAMHPAQAETTGLDEPTLAGAIEAPDGASVEAPPSGLSEPVAAMDGVEEAPPAAHDIHTVGGDVLDEVRQPRRRTPVRQYKIQEVIKRRQILLVQVVKEERGNKGAALTTFLSLAGRYCVLMPNTARGGGISRKIVSSSDRKRLKSIAQEMDPPEGMGVIVRTAGMERGKAEIKRDFEFLLKTWDQIRDLTLRSTAPALVYEEGSLIKRAIRDVYGKELEEVLIEGEDGYRQAKDLMRMLMPAHARRVQLYNDQIPLFHRFQVEQQLDAMYSPTVQLKSGGYIVIDATEALVAIDVNSGRSTREHNIEETAYKTNLEAAEEIGRQLRLRDLAGLIVIDFIDMEVNRNERNVERKLKECLKGDRARIQVGRISPFGLLEMSRQRLRPSLIEASTETCAHCQGLGYVRSTESTSLVVLRAIEDEGIRDRTGEMIVHVATEVAIYLLNNKRTAVAAVEERYRMKVIIAADDTLVPPAHRIDRTQTRTPDPAQLDSFKEWQRAAPLPGEAEDPIVEEEEGETFGDRIGVAADEGEESTVETVADTPEAEEGEAERSEGADNGRGGRGRRRRRRGGRDEGASRGGRDDAGRRESRAAPVQPPVQTPANALDLYGDPTMGDTTPAGDTIEAAETDEPVDGEAQPALDADGQPRRRRRGRRGGRRRRRDGTMEPGDDAQPLSATQHGDEPVAGEETATGEPPAYEAPPIEAAAPVSVVEEPAATVSEAPAPSAAPPVTEAAKPAVVTTSQAEEAEPEKKARFGWWRR